jgi:heme-degrading monooxygenase HmoA
MRWRNRAIICPLSVGSLRYRTKDTAMLITVFRSRLRPGVRDEYVALVERMDEIARTMPGYISHKGFFADDGERVTIVEFEHEEGLRAWRQNPEHMAAQKLARQKYYTEYHVQVCTLDRESKYKAKEAAQKTVDETATAQA